MRFIFILILAAFSLSLQAQQELHSKKKKAIAAFQEANSAFLIGNYNKSIELARLAIDKDKSFDEAILLLAQSHLSKNDVNSALNVYRTKDDEIEVTFLNRIRFDIAQAQLFNGEYQKASDILEEIEGEILSIANSRLVEFKKQLNFALNQIQNGRELKVEKLKPQLNAFDMQYFPSMDAFGKLVYTARSVGSRGDEDLYYTMDSAGYWKTPKPLSENINTKLNEGTASISADGRTLVFTGCNRQNNVGSCDLYISKFDRDEWKSPEMLSRAVNSSEWDSQPSLSADGKMLYFVSRRRGGFGKEDLYVSQLVDGEWTKAQNLGESVNTAGNDSSPYIYADNKTLFFSSDGRLGMGGLDLYKTTRTNSEWQTPENLGYPINNHEDQVGYGLDTKGQAYYSVALSNGRIELFRIDIKEELALDSYYSKKIVALNKETQQPIRSEINWQLLRTGEEYKVNSNEFGVFSLLLPKRAIQSRFFIQDYEPLNVSINDDSDTLYFQPLERQQELLPTNIYFEFNSSELSEQAKNLLDKVALMLQSTGDQRLEIRGHTDKIGSQSANFRLSEARAQQVFQYLLQKNVTKENLVLLPLGESSPKVVGNTSAEHAKNRRVELVLLKNRE